MDGGAFDSHGIFIFINSMLLCLSHGPRLVFYLKDRGGKKLHVLVRHDWVIIFTGYW